MYDYPCVVYDHECLGDSEGDKKKLTEKRKEDQKKREEDKKKLKERRKEEQKKREEDKKILKEKKEEEERIEKKDGKNSVGKMKEMKPGIQLKEKKE